MKEAAENTTGSTLGATGSRADMEPPFRNGLKERGREIKVSRWVLGIAGFYCISMFLVPFMMPTGSVPELSGRANMMDYSSEGSWGNHDHVEDGEMGHNQSAHGGTFAWSELNPYYAFVYAFGDLNCHQKHERSWTINGNQMPVCARDVGIFLGLALGGWWFSRRGLNRWTIRDSFLTLFPDSMIAPLYTSDRRLSAMFGTGILFCLPVVLDGGIQAISAYESVNPVRILTGIPFGFIIGWYLCASLSSRPEKFGFEAADVQLPAGARLSTAENTSDESE
ncbi:MAG: DUF2085 domain-containing protein [Candidatus Thalassarchaeaceae archaeon]|nr:DUF2085 domain-containing protein [Candidatus Thalassarchaeaceae archaeon]